MNKTKLKELMQSKFDEKEIDLFIEFIENEKREMRGSSTEQEVKSFIKKGIGKYCENKEDQIQKL